jgi:hypothetical protein
MSLTISDEKDWIHMSQPVAITKMLEKFDLSGTKPTKSPQSPSTAITKRTDEEKTDHTRYRSAVGILLWIARCTRPDIIFTVSLLAQQQSDPSVEHWGAVIHTMRYLAGTANHGITIGPFKKAGLISTKVNSDSSYCDPQRKLFSTSGMIVTIGDSPVAWSSKRQSLHAQSSAEAEYIACSSATKEGLWINRFLRSIVKKVPHRISFPFVLVTDSESCRKMIERGAPDHGRTKHIELRHHFILEHHAKNDFSVVWIPGSKMIADILTKSYKELSVFTRFRDMLITSSQASRGSVSAQQIAALIN